MRSMQASFMGRVRAAALAGAVLGAGCGSIAQAQLIRPNSATATSEFSALYDIGNVIDGSGLPANFTPADAHANYTTNNHWTTRSGQTIGQSATFTFDTSQTIGGFYMWNHRSNGIAANSFYEVVRFDLVLRDGPNGSGNVLANLTNIDALPNVAVAQTFAFDPRSNVRSIQFIVRATENNNASPFTGLAEVAFTPCVAPERLALNAGPVCRSIPLTVSASAVASGTVTYQWRRNGTPIDPIVNPSAVTATLSLPAIEPGLGLEGTYDCVITNACGSATSPSLVVAIPTCDCIDFNLDGDFPTPLDLEDFINAVAGNLCSTCSTDLDFNNDGDFPTPLDIEAFISVSAGGACL